MEASMAKPKKNGAPTKAIPPPKRGSLTYSVPEAGAMIGLSRNSAYEAVQRGEIPSIKIGGRIFVPRLAFHQMLESAGADRRRHGETTAATAAAEG
jgi:excisionase family DNA binding protein